jgi:uncharacterized protein YjbI with pentapeptide repeats
MQGARLTAANMSNMILNGANLKDADMKGANVSGIKFDEQTTWPDGKKGSAGNPASYI